LPAPRGNYRMCNQDEESIPATIRRLASARSPAAYRSRQPAPSWRSLLDGKANPYGAVSLSPLSSWLSLPSRPPVVPRCCK